MNVVFRVDASNRIGSGHVMRCKTLAEELQRRGAEIIFICREHNGNLIQFLRQLGFSVESLPAIGSYTKNNDLSDFNEWLNIDSAIDAHETIEALSDFNPDWLVVDHYGIDSNWEEKLKIHVKSILVIDDLANRKHDCDILLDQNWFGGETNARYIKLLPEHCLTLLGPRYALLPPVYPLIRSGLSCRDGKINRALIFMGGVDSGNQTIQALKALCHPELKYIAVDVVIGKLNSSAVEIENLVSKRHRTTIYRNLPNLAGLMARADLMLGAGGSTTWERCCLGLPAVVTIVSDNQKKFTQLLANENVHVLAGDATNINSNDWSQKILELFRNKSRTKELSKSSLRIADGQGLNRVSTRMQGNISSVNVKEASYDDEQLLFEWVNDPSVRSSAFNSVLIQFDEHRDWFIKKLNENDSLILIGMDSYGLPIGQVRFENNKEETHIDVSVDYCLRGLGIGLTLIQKAIEFWLSLDRNDILVAEVLPSNTTSQNLFIRSGFEKSNIKGQHGSIRYTLVN